MRGKKRAIIGVLMILLICCLSGCGNLMTAVYDDDTMIVKDSNTYNKINWRGNIEGEKYTISAQRFEGMDTIWTYDAPEDTSIEITYLAEVDSGKMKLVLIAPDDTLTTIAEITAESSMEEAESATFSVNKGKNRIKIVGGKDTELNIEVSVSEGTFRMR